MAGKAKTTKTTTPEPVIIWPSKRIPYDDKHPDWIDPAILLANPKNARIHPLSQAQALTGSISALGWLDSAKVNARTNFLFDGHERVRLAIEHKQPQVPVAWYDLTESEEDLALVIFDQITGLAGVDLEKRKRLLVSLGESVPRETEVLIRQLRIQAGLKDIDFDKARKDIEARTKRLVKFAANDANRVLSYQVLITCDDENQQAELLQRFKKENLDVRSIIQ